MHAFHSSSSEPQYHISWYFFLHALQKAPTVRAFQSPTKPTFRVATYAADADINGWITYDDVHW